MTGRCSFFVLFCVISVEGISTNKKRGKRKKKVLAGSLSQRLCCSTWTQYLLQCNDGETDLVLPMSLCSSKLRIVLSRVLSMHVSDAGGRWGA